MPYFSFLSLFQVKSNQMDSTSTQFVISSLGPLYTSDKVLLNLERSGSSKAGGEVVSQKGFLLSPPGQNYHQELLLHPESSLNGSSLLHQSTSPSISSSSQYSSPPSSPTFTSTSCSPSSSPPCPSTSCALLPFPDRLSPLITPLSLQRPVFVPQHILPHMTRDLTPPQSLVLALRQEPFPLPNQHAWRPWSWTLTTLRFPILGTAPMEKWWRSHRGILWTYVVACAQCCHLLFYDLNWLFIVLSNDCLPWYVCDCSSRINQFNQSLLDYHYSLKKTTTIASPLKPWTYLSYNFKSLKSL